MESDLIKLYSGRLLALAAQIPLTGRLEAPMGSAMARSPLCGSRITVDLVVVEGRIADFRQDVKACALGQAAASVVGSAVLGTTGEQVQRARDELHAMLTQAAPAPHAPFSELEALMAARDYPNRHASILLALDATLLALREVKKNAANPMGGGSGGHRDRADR